METNKKRYWLRGGIILALVIVILDFAGGYLFWVHSVPSLKFIVWASLISIMPSSFINQLTHGLMTPVMLPVNIVFYFVLGSIIGWIYGKIKNKTKK